MPLLFNFLDIKATFLVLKLKIYMARLTERLLPLQSTRSIPRTLALENLLLV